MVAVSDFITTAVNAVFCRIVSMKITQISRHLTSAFTFACAMSVAPLATAQTMAAPSGTMAPVSSMAPMAGPMTGKLSKTDEFKTEALATAHCPGDTVVWSTLSKTKTYHLADSRYYGKTKHGAYVCKGDAVSAGFRALKS
jgi:hypothetical protein